jgi:hypothetical protein
VRTAAALAVAAALSVSGCGTSSPSTDQLRSAATRACVAAGRELSRIPTPGLPSGGEAFLAAGVTALRGEQAALNRLSASGDVASAYARATSATRRELSVMESTLKGLKAGNDPVVAIKTLQQQLLPSERLAATSWRGVGVTACADS